MPRFEIPISDIEPNVSPQLPLSAFLSNKSFHQYTDAQFKALIESARKNESTLEMFIFEWDLQS